MKIEISAEHGYDIRSYVPDRRDHYVEIWVGDHQAFRMPLVNDWQLGRPEFEVTAEELVEQTVARWLSNLNDLLERGDED